MALYRSETSTEPCPNFLPAYPVVLEHHLATTGEIQRYLMLDGTYFNGYCMLMAYNGSKVIKWQFCDSE